MHWGDKATTGRQRKRALELNWGGAALADPDGPTYSTSKQWTQMALAQARVERTEVAWCGDEASWGP